MGYREEILELRDRLRQWEREYYVLNQPTVSDVEFDMEMKRLERLEAEHPDMYDRESPTQRVGSDVSKGFERMAHERAMLSLGNTYSAGEVEEWYVRTRKALGGDFDVVCELKFDGSSISIVYEDGELDYAVTRGDGRMGDVVTQNIRQIANVPHRLSGEGWPGHVEFRGEVLMPWESFERLNREREAEEEQLFANPRNAASGTLKLMDPKEVRRRGLCTYIYYTLGDGLTERDHYAQMQKAREWGLNVSREMKVCHNIEEVMQFIEYWDTERKNLPVATDGMVLKVNSIAQQEELGNTAKSPRWAIAYKFQPENALTKLEEVTYQVGRTGVVTPVANLDAVQLSGTVVRRATLHNEDFMRQLDLHEGDMVYVEKGGEIIPKITAVELKSRLAGARPVEFVKTCPECGAELVRNEEEAAWYCPNELGCAPQIKGKLEHFVGRKAMNIEGIGTEVVAAMYDLGLVRNVADLYRLTYNDLRRIEGFADKSARNVLAELQKSREVPFERVLFAIGIRFVGEVIAKKLAKAFGSMEALSQATVGQMTEVDDIGERIAESVVRFFQDGRNVEIVARLREYGLKMSYDREDVLKSNVLEGKTVVVSGRFELHSRDEYKAMIEAHGGKVGSSVSAKTSMILAGSDMGPAKREKAEALGIKIINEDEFIGLLPAENAKESVRQLSLDL